MLLHVMGFMYNVTSRNVLYVQCYVT